MDAVGFLVTLEARDGVADDVADFLMSAKELVDDEPGTLLWFAFRRGPKSFGIFDIFANEVDRDIHLHGEVRKALEAHGNSLLSHAPEIIPIKVLASKLPGEWPDLD